VVPLLTNAIPGLTDSYASATVTLSGVNLVAPGKTPSVTIGGTAAAIVPGSGDQITLVIPASLPPGPATVNWNNGLTNALPVVVNIDGQPATITAFQNSGGGAIDNNHPAHPGDLISIALSGFGTGRVQISVGGVLHTPLSVTNSPDGSGQVVFVLNANEQVGAAQPVIVYLDGHSSYPGALPVARADGSFTPLEQSTN
jgi:uncharacterized protein (TIGR03437 family)